MEESIPLGIAIFVEMFISLHMSAFVLYPLAKIYFPNNAKIAFAILFIIRAIFLIYCDIFVSTNIMIFDFFMVFIGFLILVPLSAIIKRKNVNDIFNQGQMKNAKRMSEEIQKYQENNLNQVEQWDIDWGEDAFTHGITTNNNANNNVNNNISNNLIKDSTLKSYESAIKQNHSQNDDVIKYK